MVGATVSPSKSLLTSDTIRVSLPSLHPAQHQVLGTPARYRVVACGRRWGKSTLALRLLARAALDGKPVAYFAPTYKLLLPIWDELTRRLAPVITAKNVQERRIQLITGGAIECWSLDRPDAGRSRKYALAVIDEAALVADLDYAYNAAIRPTLADLRGEAWLLSTPKGKQTFYDLYRRGEQGEPGWAAFRFSTATNPHIHPDEIAAMRSDMPAHIAAQEIDAEFLDAAGSLFRREQIRIVDDAPPGLRWARAYDLAASTKTSADYSASIACAIGSDGTVYLRDGWRMRAEWPDVRRVIIETMRAEPTALHVIEQAMHGLAAVQELLREPALYGIAITAQPVDRDKYTRALPLAARAEQGKLALVRGAWVSEWLDEALRFPAATHDDYVDAATLAYAAAAQHSMQLILAEA